MTILRAHPLLLAATLTVAALIAPGQAARAQAQASEETEVTNSFNVELLTPQQWADRSAGERTEARQRIQRLEDPQQRSAVLQELREQVRTFNPGLAEVLGIDATLESRLLQLLAEQRLVEDLRYNQHRLARAEGRHSDSHTDDQQTVARFDRERGAIKSLLGHAVFRRYLGYLDTFIERAQVAYFDGQLGEQRLRRDQKEKLVAVMAGQRRERSERTRLDPTGVVQPETFAPMYNGGSEAWTRANLLGNVRLNEAVVAAETQLSQQLLQATAKFLNSAQQAALASRESRNLEGQRRNLRSLRRQAGMDPDQPLDTLYPRTAALPEPLARSMRWTLKITVNQREQQVNFNSRSGEVVTFEPAAGLSMDAVATAYDNGRMRVHLAVFEQDEAGRYHLGDLDGSGPLNPGVDGGSNTGTAPVVTGTFSNTTSNVAFNPAATLSVSGTVLAGSKGYALSISPYGVLQ